MRSATICGARPLKRRAGRPADRAQRRGCRRFAAGPQGDRPPPALARTVFPHHGRARDRTPPDRRPFWNCLTPAMANRRSTMRWLSKSWATAGSTAPIGILNGPWGEKERLKMDERLAQQLAIYLNARGAAGEVVSARGHDGCRWRDAASGDAGLSHPGSRSSAGVGRQDRRRGRVHRRSAVLAASAAARLSRVS